MAKIPDILGPSGDGKSPRKDRQGSVVATAEMSGFPFPGYLGPPMAKLNERGRGRVIGFATGNTPGTSEQGQAFMFAIPYRASNRNGGPETEVLLISPSPKEQDGYRFVVVTPKLGNDYLIDFGAMLMPPATPGTPYLIRGWKPEKGMDPVDTFLRDKRTIAPFIGVDREITRDTDIKQAWADAVARTEDLVVQKEHAEARTAMGQRVYGMDHDQLVAELRTIFTLGTTSEGS